MKTIFRATKAFIEDAKRDLTRPHRFAAERVAFISIRAAYSADHLLLIAQGYHPVADDDYVDDSSVGALMGQEAIRKALEIALLQPVGMVHVHLHDHRGVPRYSRIDLREQVKFVPDFFKVRPEMPHGAIVLSRDHAIGRIWLGPDEITRIAEFGIVGPQVVFHDGTPSTRIDFTA